MTTTDFDKKVTCGSDFVAVRIIENCEDLKVGDIYIPQQVDANDRLAHCIIESIGTVAAEKTGCAVGEFIMIDRLATFGHTSPVACLKYDSVICKTNESKSEFFPLKDMMFVEADEKEQMQKVGAIYVPDSYQEKLRLGVVTKVGFEKTESYPFEVGSHVMLVKGGDVVQFGETVVQIYKKDMIVCTVND